MPPAARVTDMHVCPMVTGVVPHVGGPILPPGVPTVLIDFLPAATVTDMATCVGPPDVIVMGSAGVFINFLPAARMGDPTAHGGVIVLGSPTCIIGEVGSPSPGAAGVGAVVAGLAASGVKPTKANASAYSIPSGASPILTRHGSNAVTKSAKYSSCPDSVKDQIASKMFTDDEKKGIHEVFGKYKSLMQCKDIPLKKIGRTDLAITKNGTCVAETSTMGEWFDDSGTVVLTDAASNPVDFTDQPTQFRATFAHEAAHALLNNFDPRSCKSYANSSDNPLMKEFHVAAGWDPNGTTLVETATDKAPTSYAKTNDEEDLSESMMLYLYDPDRLKNASPARYAFCDNLMNESELSACTP